MDYKSLVLLILIHITFDFLLQSRETATNKSIHFKHLANHLVTLAVGLILFTILSHRYTLSQAFIYVNLNLIAHGLIDWNIWRLYKYTIVKRYLDVDMSFKYWEDRMFYNFIALDQGLHALCYLGLDYLVRSGL